MSLSLAISNALTGLRANTTQADIISNNVANALTQGYARRSVGLAPASAGGIGSGVRVDGIIRASSPAVTEARRVAQSAAGAADTAMLAQNRLANVIGEPGAPRSLATTADRLDSTLAAAIDSPESAVRLSDAVTAAVDYAASINRIAAEAVALRTEADASISGQVRTINTSLTAIQSLNAEIKARALGGGDVSALLDQRAQLIEKISAMIPVRTVARDNEQVALFARNGGQLLDGAVFELGFEPTRLVTADQTLANGALSGITTNGQPVRIGEAGEAGLFDGGSLAAAFAVRDRIVPAVADTLDTLAADLIGRVQGLGADPSLAPGDAGLFTDGGGAFDPANLTGLAGRIAVNAAVNPATGGAVTRLRDGINAAAVGDAGDAGILTGLQDALRALIPAPTGGDLTGQRASAGFAAELSAMTLSDAARADEDSLFRKGRLDQLKDAELSDTGVDTDQELSRLLLVEQSFAANARVIQVIDGLLEQLLRI